MSTTGGYNSKPGVQIGANCRMATFSICDVGLRKRHHGFLCVEKTAVLHSSTKVKVSISTANFWIANIGTTGVHWR